MNAKISDLTVDELKSLISETVHDVMKDFIEDIQAMSSKDYIISIKEAREDYKTGNYKDYDEIF